MRQIQFFPCL